MSDKTLAARDGCGGPEHLGIRAQCHRQRRDAGPVHLEAALFRHGRADGRDLLVAAEHRDQVRFGACVGAGLVLGDEPVHPKPHVNRRVPCHFVELQCSHPQVGILHGFDSRRSGWRSGHRSTRASGSA